MRRHLVVIGAHALAHDPRSLAWVDRLLQVEIQALARQGEGLVVTAGSPGPEVHAEMLAMTFGVPVIAWLANGERRANGRRAGHWAAPGVSGSAAVARRDLALIERVSVAPQVRVLALLLPDLAAQSSARTRAAKAEARGLAVQRLVWGAAAEVAA